MSWGAILALAAGAYAFKALGLLVIGARQPTGPLVQVITYLPPALLAALVVVQTVAVGDELVVDERILGVTAGALAVWRKAPFVVVLLVAAAVTALARQLLG